MRTSDARWDRSLAIAIRLEEFTARSNADASAAIIGILRHFEFKSDLRPIDVELVEVLKALSHERARQLGWGSSPVTSEP